MSHQSQVDSVLDGLYEEEKIPQSRLSRDEQSLQLSDLTDNTDLVEDLYNASQPKYVRKHEQLHHRLFIQLKSQGFSNLEIAKRTGYTTECVGDVLKQPWAKMRVLEEMRANGRDEVLNIFQLKASDLAWDLVEIAENKEEKGSVRVSAILAVHERLMGKAVQPLTHQTLETRNLSDADLLKELESIKRSGSGSI